VESIFLLALRGRRVAFKAKNINTGRRVGKPSPQPSPGGEGDKEFSRSTTRHAEDFGTLIIENRRIASMKQASESSEKYTSFALVARPVWSQAATFAISGLVVTI